MLPLLSNPVSARTDQSQLLTRYEQDAGAIVTRARLDRGYLAEQLSFLSNLPAELASPRLQGYRATFTALAANQASTPWQKLKLLRESRSLFAQALAAAPDSWELRFLRLMVERSLPKQLCAQSQIAADAKYLSECLEQRGLFTESQRQQVIAHLDLTELSR